jgi:site-specific recombinase XerD
MQNLDLRLKQFSEHLIYSRSVSKGTHDLYLKIVSGFFHFLTKNYCQLYLSDHWEWKDVDKKTLRIYLNSGVGARGGGLKENTILSHQNAIKAFFRFLIEEELIQKNPVQEALLDENIKGSRFLQSCKKSPDVLVAYIESLLCREPNELMQAVLLGIAFCTALSPSDLERIQQIRPQEDGGVSLHFNDGAVSAPIDLVTALRLENYNELLSGFSSELGGYFVNLPEGACLNRADITKILRKHLRRIDFTIREMREVSTQYFLKNGADIRSVQKIRGVKKVQRLQNLQGIDFEALHKKFSASHARNP